MPKIKRHFRIRLLLWFNQFFVVLLLLSYLAPYIPPKVFWPFAVLGIAYPLFLSINILFVIFWLVLVKRNFLYSLIAILIGLHSFNTHFRFKKNHPETGSNDLKIVSFNVKNLSNNNEKYADANIRSAILDYLTTQNAQIVCLQEFQTYPTKGINTVTNFQNRLALPYYSESVYVKKSRFKFVDLMVTYSKYPIVYKEILSYKEKTYAIINDLVIDRDTVRLFNVHLESNHFARNEYDIFTPSEKAFSEETGNQLATLIQKLSRYSKVRNTQVIHLRNHIQASPYPVILCGDFNDTPGSYAYHQLAHNLNDAFIERGKGYGNTFNGKLPAMRIDYVLADTNFQFTQFEIGHLNKSDHFPIITRLKLSDK